MPTDSSPAAVSTPSSPLGREASSSDDFATTIWVGPDKAVVALRGELDLATAPLARRLLDAVAERGYARVVLDIAALNFMDASGISFIVAASKGLPPSGELTLRSPWAMTRRRLHKVVGSTRPAHGTKQ